jgi:DNA polymerase III epsilon subunit family exonuclease
MVNERYAVVDVETTGFSPVSDRIVEVACVLVDGDAVVDRWSTLINPQRPIPERATAVHGITDRAVRGAPLLADALSELREVCSGRLLVAHNAQFDLAFLSGLDHVGGLCTMRLARVLFPEAPNHKNQTLRAFLEIDREIGEEVGAHRALDDAVVTAHVLLACWRRFVAQRSAEGWRAFARSVALVGAPGILKAS